MIWGLTPMMRGWDLSYFEQIGSSRWFGPETLGVRLLLWIFTPPEGHVQCSTYAVRLVDWNTLATT